MNEALCQAFYINTSSYLILWGSYYFPVFIAEEMEE